LTVTEAVAVPPEPARLAVPRVTVPAVKVTVPVGDVVPLAAFTVTVTTVEALWAMLVGFAASEAVVVTSGAVTLTGRTAETEPVKFVVPA
jgi:hypothetical protein